MNIPIVMAAFGTTSRALETYSFIDEICRGSFPGHEILWSYSSRMVKDWIKKRRNIDLKHPHQVLAELKDKGHKWAVVQSLHLLCGHEFYRMVEEVGESPVRTSIGLPLLTHHEDYEAVVGGLGKNLSQNEDEAVVLVGHGTDHPIWSSYCALHHMFRKKFGAHIYVGVVEGDPSRDKIITAVKGSGVEKVRLIPFMFVAGTHFQEDLAGDDDSWKTAFEEEGISVSLEERGLGLRQEIVEIFCRHIREAINVIPSDLRPG